MPDKLFSELAATLSPTAQIIRDLTDYENYCHDATIEKGTPAALIFAQDEDDICQIVNFCQKNKISLVPRGAGTGLSGGAVPQDGAIVLSLEKMTRLRFDTDNKIAFAQTGVITKTILDEANKLNLFYPPDPASYDESTIGGNVAENAGGLKCVKYGVTKDYVLGIRGITPNGKIIKTGIYNHNAGFDFTELFIGSEGTLIIITEVALKLIDLPKSGETILSAFDNPKDAAQTVADIRMKGITPIVMEFLDGDAAACSNSYERNNSLDNVAAILLIESEAVDSEEIETACHNNNCTYIKREVDSDKADELWKVRRNLSKAVKELSVVRISEDVAVPISKFPLLVDFVYEMNKRSNLRINSYGHAGDGNLHVNFMGQTDSDAELCEMEIEIEHLLHKAIALGGTLTGEHGIGLAKKKYLHYEFDKNCIDYMKRVKSTFDESNFLNPNKIFI